MCGPSVREYSPIPACKLWLAKKEKAQTNGRLSKKLKTTRKDS